MAYDERLAERVRNTLAKRRRITEKKMFGGLAFLLGGRMCYGVLAEPTSPPRAERRVGWSALP